MTATKSIGVLALHQTVMPAPPSWLQAPARVNCPHVLRFCGQLHPTNRPVVVPVRPELLYGRGPFPMGRCYEGVADYQERVGGTYQHGWMLWETEGIYLRAYHHCVHRIGTFLTDVSPQPHKSILFLPTAEPGVPDKAYREAKRRDAPDGVGSCYYPLSDSVLARRIVSLHEAKHRAVKHSPEWFCLLDEIGRLEVEFREWAEAKSVAARRRKATRRRAKGRG